MATKQIPAATADAVFKALGSPARLAITRSLIEGERCVCELVEACGLGWSATSKHLDVLRAAGVVSSQKRAQKIFYRLDLACVADFVRCLDRVCMPAGACCRE
jgi:DNA-binding transcriptional ArsR family regulator